MNGRPKKPESDRKTNCLYVMMTDADRAIIDAVARAEGEDTSTWARRLLLAHAKGWQNGTASEAKPGRQTSKAKKS